MNIPFVIEDEALKSIEEVMFKSATRAFEAVGKKKVYPRYMTKKMACEYLDISFNTLTKWINLGLPLIDVDGMNKLDKHDIDAFTEAHKI